MRAALRSEAILLSRRWPELLLLVFLSVCVGLYRTLGRGEVTAMRILTNQRFALLPCWALAEVVFRSRQGTPSIRVSVLSGHTRIGAFTAKLTVFLLLELVLDALGCAVGLVNKGCFSAAVLPPLLLRLFIDLGFSTVLQLIVQLPLKNPPTCYLLSGVAALALGMPGGMDGISLAFSLILLIVCPALAWRIVRRCEL